MTIGDQPPPRPHEPDRSPALPGSITGSSRSGPHPGQAAHRAVIYVRTPPGSDAGEAGRQLGICRDKAADLDLSVIAEIQDLGSPASLRARRPGWARVVDLVSRNEARVVLCSDFTRITDSWADVHLVMTLVREHGIDVVTSGDNPSRRRRES